MAIIGPALGLVLRRHRYQCTNCGWTGWKRRLQRRAVDDVSAHHRSTEHAVGFVFLAVVVLLVAAALLVRSCETPRRDDLGATLEPAAERLFAGFVELPVAANR